VVICCLSVEAIGMIIFPFVNYFLKISEDLHMLYFCPPFRCICELVALEICVIKDISEMTLQVSHLPWRVTLSLLIDG